MGGAVGFYDMGLRRHNVMLDCSGEICTTSYHVVFTKEITAPAFWLHNFLGLDKVGCLYHHVAKKLTVWF